MKNLKGQVLVFENVLIFALGVTIFLLCYSTFTVYHSYFADTAVNDQIIKVKEFLVSNILLVSEREGNSTVTLNIPKRVGGEEYIIHLSRYGLNVTTGSRYRFSSLFGLNRTFHLSGKTASLKGKITIYKRGGRIIIV